MKVKRLDGVRKGDNLETQPWETNDDSIYVPASLWTAGCCEYTSFLYYELESYLVIDRNINERGKMHTQQISVKILQILLGKTISLPKKIVYVLKFQTV